MLELTFALLVFLMPLAYSPGPGNMVFAAIGGRFGLRASIPASAGYHLATFAVTAAVGLGFSGLARLSPMLLDILTRGGAGSWPVLGLHILAGAGAGTLSLWRLLRWMRRARAQARLSPRLAAAVHLALSVLPLGMTASGIGMLLLTGAAYLPAGAPLPEFGTVPPAMPHAFGAKGLIGLVSLHIAAAVLHHWQARPGAAA